MQLGLAMTVDFASSDPSNFSAAAKVWQGCHLVSAVGSADSAAELGFRETTEYCPDSSLVGWWQSLTDCLQDPFAFAEVIKPRSQDCSCWKYFNFGPTDLEHAQIINYFVLVFHPIKICQINENWFNLPKYYLRRTSSDASLYRSDLVVQS